MRLWWLIGLQSHPPRLIIVLYAWYENKRSVAGRFTGNLGNRALISGEP